MLRYLGPELTSLILGRFFQCSLRSRIASAVEGGDDLGTATVLTGTHIPALPSAGSAGAGFLTLSEEWFG